jgi:gliding motility-associated-like protein
MRRCNNWRYGSLFLPTSAYHTLYKKLTYHLITIVIFLNVGLSFGQQLDPPTITCIELHNNGDVLINWIPTTDPGGLFTQYHVLSSTNVGGPYLGIGTVNSINTSSYLSTSNPSPPTAPTYFQIVTHSTDGTTIYNSNPSLTVGTIFLTALPSTSPLGYANLSWNSPFPPSTPAPAGIMYEIWMERGGVWSQIQTVPYGTNQWAYEIVEMCDEFISFQVRLAMPAGCIFLSNTASGTYRDLISPDIPIITSVTIDHATSDAVIHWEPSSAPDTKGYLLYKCQGSPPTTTLIGTVMGQSSSSFTDLVTNTATGPVQYAIAAFDSCYLLTPPMVPASPIGPCNRSIYLQSLLYTNCDDFIRLNWQHYDGWQHGVDTYTVYHGFSTSPPNSGGPVTYTAIGTVNGSIGTFIHHGIPAQDGYNYYYIEGTASQTGYTANSNLQVIYVNYPTPPSYAYLGSVSVISTDSTLIQVDVDPTPFPHEFRLQRLGVNSEQWMDIASHTVSATSQIEFIDKGLSNDVLVYEYRVIVKNGCGYTVDTTNTGRNIVLDAVVNTDLFINILSWTDYGEWDNGVLNYRIYREIDDSGAEEMIAEINSSAMLFYDDKVDELLFTQGKFCYYIEAVESPTSPSGIEHVSRSNKICVNQDPVIWIPNAFVVGGHNTTFRPVISFADFETYRMIIFSRWGDVIYDTTDFDAPWDGMFEDSTVPQGAYVYFITIKDGLGRAIEKRGLVNVIVSKGIR